MTFSNVYEHLGDNIDDEPTLHSAPSISANLDDFK
jgi:hypothetical protein